MSEIEKFNKVLLPDNILKTVNDLAYLVAEYCVKRDGTNPKEEYRKACESLYKTFKDTEINLNLPSK